jgi:pimeloyl-ACP methyl ester carboxylesterase
MAKGRVLRAFLFQTIIEGLDQQPAVIGHSFGGLLTQILAGRGLATVGGHRPGPLPRGPAPAHLRAQVTIDHGWREVAQTALAFIQRFTCSPLAWLSVRA